MGRSPARRSASGSRSLIGVGIIASAITRARHPNRTARASWSPIHRGTLTVVVVLFIAVVGAPFVEELFFRGLLMSGFVARFGAAARHHLPGDRVRARPPRPDRRRGNLGVFLLIAPVGVVLGVLRFGFKRLGTGMFTHAAYNAIIIDDRADALAGGRDLASHADPPVRVEPVSGLLVVHGTQLRTELAVGQRARKPRCAYSGAFHATSTNVVSVTAGYPAARAHPRHASTRSPPDAGALRLGADAHLLQMTAPVDDVGHGVARRPHRRRRSRPSCDRPPRRHRARRSRTDRARRPRRARRSRTARRPSISMSWSTGLSAAVAARITVRRSTAGTRAGRPRTWRSRRRSAR